MFADRKISNVNDITSKNICNIQSDVERIEGISSNSASPTDSWILYFKDNVVYENKIITNAFMKIYINPTNYTSISGKLSPELYALDYETLVYRDIIKPFVDQNICPNFVKYISSGISCTYKNLLDFLTDGKLKNNNLPLNNKQCNINLNRNISYM